MNTVSVRFVKSFAQVDVGSYSAGEGAGFSPEVAEALIRSGVAEKVPVWESQALLIRQALTHRDEDVRRPADLLLGLPARLQALDDRATVLWAEIKDSERAEAQALIHGQPLPQVEHIRTELTEVERQKAVLVQQADYVFHDLVTALSRAIKRDHAAILEKVKPVLRAVRDKIAKAQQDYRTVESDIQRLNELRALQQALDPLQVLDLDDAEGALVGDYLGESLVGVSGRRMIPQDAASLISGVAMNHALR